MAPEDEPRAIFAYGTLKQGEINHALLVPYADRIEPAWIRGSLYDVGEFPALGRGEGWVSGELVSVRPDRMAQAIALLDRLERFNPEDPSASLYLRERVEVTLRGDRRLAAYAYFYNGEHPALPALSMLPPIPTGHWTGIVSSQGIQFGELEAFRDHVRSFQGKS